MMAFTYNPLWKLLEEKRMNKTELAKRIGISRVTLAKMTSNEPLNLRTIEMICNELRCGLNDVVEFIPEKTELAKPVKQWDIVKIKDRIYLVVKILEISSLNLDISNVVTRENSNGFDNGIETFYVLSQIQIRNTPVNIRSNRLCVNWCDYDTRLLEEFGRTEIYPTNFRGIIRLDKLITISDGYIDEIMDDKLGEECLKEVDFKLHLLGVLPDEPADDTKE